MESTKKGPKKILEINGRNKIHTISFIEEGKYLMTGGIEGMLRLWKVEDGREARKPIQAKGASEIYSAVLSPDRKWLACGLKHANLEDDKTNVRVWNAHTYEKVLDIDGHTDTVFSVDISPDSKRLATGSSDRLAFIWDLNSGERLIGPLQHNGIVKGVRFSPNGDRIATVIVVDPDSESFLRIYNSYNGQKLFDFPFRVRAYPTSSLAWSSDGRQLFGLSSGIAHHFDMSSGSLLGKWSIRDRGAPNSIALSYNGRFFVAVANASISFWDAFSHGQIGPVIKHEATVWSVALSQNDDLIATGDGNGTITLWGLRNVLPSSYVTVNVTSQLPFMCISHESFQAWAQDDLARVEELLTEEIQHPLNPLHHADVLAHRALLRTRLKNWDMAIEDAKKSINIESSAIAHTANTTAHVGSGKQIFIDDPSTDDGFLSLIKAIALFGCGRHDDAFAQVDGLINKAEDRSIYATVRAQMSLLLGDTSLRSGDNNRAMELLEYTQKAMPFRKNLHLVAISLIFGWDLNGLALTIQLHAQDHIKLLEDKGDSEMQAMNERGAIVLYSAALSLVPLSTMALGLFVKRGKAREVLGMWEDALEDANAAIEAQPLSPWGYERKRAVLHALRRYNESIDSLEHMLFIVEESLDPDIRQLRKKYVSPAVSEKLIEGVVHRVSKIAPLVLIDVKSGRLCDEPERTHVFKSELEFKELVSSMTQESDDRIQPVVEKYFQYVMFSHVWQGKEPSFRDVKSVDSIRDLDPSSLNKKLQKFCQVVRKEGYRWAWSDTCCIDKTISTVLNQSLTMMYKWYEASAATLVLLASVASPSALGDLTNSMWMTRAWTAQELLAPKVIRFYDCKWIPYLGDTRANHKESPEIMQELASAIGVARETITAFNPDSLSVREKLRVSSTRNATVDEDIAYSLIGVFRSDIRPHYGEGDAALGHLLEEIVARSGDVTVLSWTGKSSSYNSCLPATLAVYNQAPYISPVLGTAEMEMGIGKLRGSLSEAEAKLIHERITRLPPARFANRRLYLPCIIFSVKRLGVQDFGDGQENRYRARVPGIGFVEFQTQHKLSLMEPRKLILAHPWIRDLRDPLDGFMRATPDDDEYESDSEGDASSELSFPLPAIPTVRMDDYTRALRLLVRLHQPFHALLLQQQTNGEFRRIATEYAIIIPGLEPRTNFGRDIHVEVVEIL